MSFFGEPFMQYALLAGSAIALASGLIGYFVVLRAQVFTGDALSHVAFTGALAALAIGLEPRIGLFVFTIAVALVMGALGPRGRADDTIVGSIFAWILGLGVLFLTIYTRSEAAASRGTSAAVLFGSILGLSGRQALVAALIGAGVVAAIIAVGRPLLFASLDEAVAAARGVPVRLLGVGFLGLVGVTAGLAAQAVGALLLLGLLAAPAGTAHRLTSRPYLGLALSGFLAVCEMWAGLIISYVAPRVPPSFAVLAVASGVYFGVVLVGRRPRWV